MTEILLQVRISKKRIPAVRKDLAQPDHYKAAGLRLFLSLAALSTADTLEFRASGHDFDSEYGEDDEDLVLALKAPWSDFDDIAAWLTPHAARGSRLLVHSLEANGNEFGYEFDGRGRCRLLLLAPRGTWVTPDRPRSTESRPPHGKKTQRGRHWAKWPRRQGAKTVAAAWRIIGSAYAACEFERPAPAKQASGRK